MARLNGKEMNKAAYGPGGYLQGQDNTQPSFTPGGSQPAGVISPSAFTLNSFTSSGSSPSKIIHLNIVSGPVSPALYNVYVSDNGGSFSKEASNQGPFSLAATVYNSPNNKVTGHLYVYFLALVLNGVEGLAGPNFACQL